jgi:hypothetical protein
MAVFVDADLLKDLVLLGRDNPGPEVCELGLKSVPLVG